MEGDRSSSSIVVIDIEKLHSLMQNNPDYHCTSYDTTNKRKAACLVSKVPPQLHSLYNNVYDPVVVSIGPYHHGDRSLQVMEMKKWRCVDFILKANTRIMLDDYLKGLCELYPLARSYYTDETKIDSNKFVQMLLLDGCFILMALCQMDFIPISHNFLLENDNENQVDPWQKNFIYDLLLVENQIPFVVVKRIYELITGEENTTPSLTNEVTNFVEQILCRYPKAIRNSDRPKSFHHFLHLCHMYLRPSKNYDHIFRQPNHNSRLRHQWHQAVEYYQAGLEFVKREFDERNPHSLLDVRLSNNRMEIPCLPIDEDMITIFRNLVAFEHLNPQFGNNITTYIIFMSELIRNAEDVGLLVSEGIIEHHFRSDEEVANLFMELSAGVEFDFADNFYMKDICQVLGELYESRMKWKRWLWETSTTIRDWILNS